MYFQGLVKWLHYASKLLSFSFLRVKDVSLHLHTKPVIDHWTIIPILKSNYRVVQRALWIDINFYTKSYSSLSILSFVISAYRSLLKVNYSNNMQNEASQWNFYLIKHKADTLFYLILSTI